MGLGATGHCEHASPLQVVSPGRSTRAPGPANPRTNTLAAAEGQEPEASGPGLTVETRPSTATSRPKEEGALKGPMVTAQAEKPQPDW